MLICTEGVEGKKLGVNIHISNKRTFFEKGKEAHPPITLAEEEWILERQKKNPFTGWKLEKVKPSKTKKEVDE